MFCENGWKSDVCSLSFHFVKVETRTIIRLRRRKKLAGSQFRIFSPETEDSHFVLRGFVVLHPYTFLSLTDIKVFIVLVPQGSTSHFKSISPFSVHISYIWGISASYFLKWIGQSYSLNWIIPLLKSEHFGQCPDLLEN